MRGHRIQHSQPRQPSPNKQSTCLCSVRIFRLKEMRLVCHSFPGLESRISSLARSGLCYGAPQFLMRLANFGYRSDMDPCLQPQHPPSVLRDRTGTIKGAYPNLLDCEHTSAFRARFLSSFNTFLK